MTTASAAMTATFITPTAISAISAISKPPLPGERTASSSFSCGNAHARMRTL
jgi:hypothetical protein